MHRAKIKTVFDDGTYAIDASTDGHRLEIHSIDLCLGANKAKKTISVHPSSATWAVIERHCRRDIIGKVIVAAPVDDSVEQEVAA